MRHLFRLLAIALIAGGTLVIAQATAEVATDAAPAAEATDIAYCYHYLTNGGKTITVVAVASSGPAPYWRCYVTFDCYNGVGWGTIKMSSPWIYAGGVWSTTCPQPWPPITSRTVRNVKLIYGS